MPNTEAIRPAYYKLQIGETEFDVFDLVRAIQAKRPFPFELSSALKYIVRLKEDTNEKQINDLQKAQECIGRYIEFLQGNAGKENVVVLEGNPFTETGLCFQHGETLYVIIQHENSFVLNVMKGNEEVAITKDLLKTTTDSEAHHLENLESALAFLHTYLAKSLPHLTFSLKVDEAYFEKKADTLVDEVEIFQEKTKINGYSYFYWGFEGIQYYILQMPSNGGYVYILEYIVDGVSTYLKDYAPKFDFTKKRDDALYFQKAEDAKQLLTTYLCHISGKKIKLL